MNTIDELEDIAFLESEIKRLRAVLLLLVKATEAFVRTPSTSRNLLNTVLDEAWDILEDEDD